MTRAALVALLVGACSPQPFPLDPPRPPPPDAGTLSDCELACARLAELGCPEAKPTPAGASCVDVCWNAEDSGVVTLDPACVARTTSCDLEACSYGDP